MNPMSASALLPLLPGTAEAGPQAQVEGLEGADFGALLADFAAAPALPAPPRARPAPTAASPPPHPA
ncbi:MAG TPA: hypothetical protein PKE59_05375, partial [Novosphingobium sp.]|nr:hypothetical protein [Novosphingobium sp.]